MSLWRMPVDSRLLEWGRERSVTQYCFCLFKKITLAVIKRRKWIVVSVLLVLLMVFLRVLLNVVFVKQLHRCITKHMEAIVQTLAYLFKLSSWSTHHGLRQNKTCSVLQIFLWQILIHLVLFFLFQRVKSGMFMFCLFSIIFCSHCFPELTVIFCALTENGLRIFGRRTT